MSSLRYLSFFTHSKTQFKTRLYLPCRGRFLHVRTAARKPANILRESWMCPNEPRRDLHSPVQAALHRAPMRWAGLAAWHSSRHHHQPFPTYSLHIYAARRPVNVFCCWRSRRTDTVCVCVCVREREIKYPVFDLLGRD